MDPDDRATCLAVAAALERGGLIERLSRPLTVAALLCVPAVLAFGQGMTLLVIAVPCALLGLVQSYFGARAAFDASLFRDLGHGDAELAALDVAFARLTFVAPDRAGRPLDMRVAGAMKLLRSQVIFFAIQAGSLVALAPLQLLGSP